MKLITSAVKKLLLKSKEEIHEKQNSLKNEQKGNVSTYRVHYNTSVLWGFLFKEEMAARDTE